MSVPTISMQRRRGLAFTAVAAVALLIATACSPTGGESAGSASAAPSTVAPPPTTDPPVAHELVTGEDVAILDRLMSPTTGETWQTPVEIDNLGLFAYPASEPTDTYRYFHIGDRADARIIAVVDSYFDELLGGHTVFAVIEHDGTTARMITCPSARASVGCLDFSTDWLTPERALDTAIHYDSLTYPSQVQPAAGWTLRLAPLAYSSWPVAREAFGDANDYPGIGLSADARAAIGREGERIVLAELGESTLVEWRSSTAMNGLAATYLAIETPYDGVIASWRAFVADWYGVGAVTWDDGADTFTHPDVWTGDPVEYQVQAANPTCSWADESLATTFDASQWVKAGTHRQGVDVYVPSSDRNAIAQRVYRAMSEGSWGDDIDPALAYPYASIDEFLNARSIFAWQRPDGEWVIALDSFAAQRVWECV